jgi:4-hydroxybenzoate polyprenyltransferase
LIYNVKPARAKEIPYVDAIVESANNPIRVALGWYALSEPTTSLPLSAVLFFWVFGAFLMTGKRLAELRFLGEHALPYRITFKYYSESSLWGLMVFYSITGVAFYIYMIIQVFDYHHLSMVGLVLMFMFYIWCFRLVMEDDSILKEPETLLKKPGFFIFCLVGLIIVITIFLIR